MAKIKKQQTTKEHILDVAQIHFAQYGFAGTSLRGIIRETGANVAAVAYHFGTKEDLFGAVIQRFSVAVVTEQLKLLEAVMNSPDCQLQSVLVAFYTPPISLVKSQGKQGQTMSLLLGRAQTEPEPIYSLVDSHFSACRTKFIEAFHRCMANKSIADHNWNFEFMLSLIVCFLTRQNQIRDRYGDSGDWASEEAINRMVAFCQSGMPV